MTHSVLPAVSADTSEAYRPVAMRRALACTYQASLGRYFMPGDGIIPRSIVESPSGWTRTEPCALNTAEVLKAAFLLEQHGVEVPFDARQLMQQLADGHLGNADYQTIALALWSAGIGEQPCADALWDLLRARLPRDASQTMPLAWTLCALCQYHPIATAPRDVSALAHEVFDRLTANQDPRTGLFYASARREGWLRRRRADTTLSSQTYPILALTRFSHVFAAGDALDRASRCAERLCSLQGPQGQWWWRYDARRGSVSQPYPVYSVNQDAAVPAALGALQNALGHARYDEAIERGLVWEFGGNEIQQSLVRPELALVARSIERCDGSFAVGSELYAYQPARGLYALASDPRWRAEAWS